MNPVDHPHGGGEGRTSGGRPSCSPWGEPTKCGYRSAKEPRKAVAYSFDGCEASAVFSVFFTPCGMEFEWGYNDAESLTPMNNKLK
ncbi:hypothetical protein IFM89_009073 [Coptis chinensis]|uniref:Ribosomal protein L2 n=1 Tax=Coptis chinensis TaxID=261450 RepID=A0A835IL24_9MAGN|nr:hypothetical protein IFM89_009073 [Coptis chinensis]